MAVTKLILFNDALQLLGERNLSSLTESREPRRLLDQVWDNGCVNYCLSQGQWNFATRSSMLTYNSSITPAFGLPRAFTRPTDNLRTIVIAQDEYFRAAVNYSDEGAYIYSNIDEIYIKYVSSDTAYGNDLSLWPLTFSEYVSAYLASKIAHVLIQDKKERDRIYAYMMAKLSDAKVKDALAEGTQFIPRGSWVSAKLGYTGAREDLSNRT